MRIHSIRPVGKRPVHDLTIDTEVFDHQNYVLGNGVITHNTGIYYSADNIFIIGRRQEKKAHEKEIRGYHFVINVEKSRYVREKAQIPITVLRGTGIDKWSALIEMAEESGHLIKTKRGAQLAWQYPDAQGDDDKKYIITDMDKEFWIPILKDKTFHEWVKDNYQQAHSKLLDDEDDVEDVYSEE